ncbi:MAG: Rrf2 family transcriptional regulator [Saprospiraceae bacterium]
MKVLSKASVYSLRALVYIVAHKQHGEYVSIGEMSKELDISFHFLTKILQQLTQEKLLVSYRGPRGGVALNKPAEEIFLIDVVKIIEGEHFFDTCLLGLPGCGASEPCPMHAFWTVARTAMEQEFANTPLSELGAKVSEDRLRLSGW